MQLGLKGKVVLVTGKQTQIAGSFQKTERGWMPVPCCLIRQT